MKLIKGLSIFMLAALIFVGCKDDDDPIELVGIKSVAVLNSGEDMQTRVDGNLVGDMFEIVVSPLSNMKSLQLEIVPNAGSTVTPESGTTIDFEANNGMQTVIASKGSETKTYMVKVTASDFVDELVIKSLKVSGVSFPEVEILHGEKKIHVTFANVTGTTATLSEFVLNPASASVKESMPAMETVDDVDLMTVDFASQGEKSITIQNGATEVKYTITATINSAGLNVASESLVHDQILGSNLDPALGTGNTRGAYFDGRYVFYASREGGNNIYYYDITDATKERKVLNMGTGIVAGGTWVISDVRVASNGNIYVSNMVNAKDSKFIVYRWDDVSDDTPEKVVEYTVTNPVAPATTVRIGDALSIVGDPKTNGHIFASNFPFNNAQQGQFYHWEFVGGVAVASAPVVVELVDKFTAPSASDKSLGQYARVNGVPGSDHYLVTGGASGIQIYDKNWASLVQVERDTPIQGRAYDPTLFEYNGVRYMAYTVNREWAANDAFIEIVALTEGDNFVEGLEAIKEKSMDDIRAYKKPITTNATVGAVWVATSSSVKIMNDKVLVFGFVAQYGGAVYEFGK